MQIVILNFSYQCSIHHFFSLFCSWPKGFGANFLYKLRVKNSACLNQKPSQVNLLLIREENSGTCLLLIFIDVIKHLV